MHARCRSLLPGILLSLLPLACTTGGEGEGEGEGEGDPPPDAGYDCGDEDPLTYAGWSGFCADRVDDNCTVDDQTTPCDSSNHSTHNYCNTADEPCPSTQPGSAPPVWDCNGTPPSNVIAFAHYTNAENPNVIEFCVYVYESSEIAGEHLVALTVVDGSSPAGPPSPPVSPAADCFADYFARRHLFFSDLDGGECAGVKFIHAYPNENGGVLYPVDEQKLSNVCRKMIKNLGSNNSGFTPAVQYFASSRVEAESKLQVLDTAEVACVGIDNINNQPYRTTERWYVQAAAPLTRVE